MFDYVMLVAFVRATFMLNPRGLVEDKDEMQKVYNINKEPAPGRNQENVKGREKRKSKLEKEEREAQTCEVIW